MHTVSNCYLRSTLNDNLLDINNFNHSQNSNFSKEYTNKQDCNKFDKTRLYF